MTPAQTHTQLTREPDAYARHGQGYDRDYGFQPTTFISADPEGRKPLGWGNGHLPEGASWGGFRLVLVDAAQAVGRAAA